LPLKPYLQGAVFDEETLAAMTAAFEDALRELRLTDRSDPITAMVAQKIIDCARQGERDPARLRDLALKDLTR